MDTTDPPPEPNVPGAPAEGDETPFALVAQFFIIPLVVVTFAVLVFFFFGLLGGRSASPQELLSEVQSGSLTRRWQAAFQLSTELSKHPELSADARLVDAILKTLTEAREADVRRYLVLALGRCDSPAVAGALIAALGDADEETRLYAALALGSRRDASAVVPLTTMLGDEAPSLRKAAAYALGHIGDVNAAAALRVAADDRSFPVALQSALALAQLGDPSGLPVLRRALDRTVLSALLDNDRMTTEQQEEAILNAIRGLQLVRDSESLATLRGLAHDDPSLKVRDAARQTMVMFSEQKPAGD